MEKISGHKAFSIHALPDGLIFPYLIEKIEEENQYRIGYKMVSFSTGKISNVTKSIFMLTKFGSEYASFIGKIKNYLTCFSILMENGQTFVVEKDGTSTLFSGADEIWSGKLLYKNTAPGGIAAASGSLWVSYPEHNVLVRYNLKTLREELRIGGNHSPFVQTEGIFPAGSKLFVCNTGSNSIWKVDTTNYITELYYKFDEPVYDYKFINKYEIVSLESGIYLL
ncbi:MAG: hypothetical protein J6Q56_01880 [Clostridia bacterium]|nr:hypothetical protein [Clostridia bacterium]